MNKQGTGRMRHASEFPLSSVLALASICSAIAQMFLHSVSFHGCGLPLFVRSLQELFQELQQSSSPNEYQPKLLTLAGQAAITSFKLISKVLLYFLVHLAH